ncbi:MAG: putative porin [Endomicrobium sp.]|jgi:hypothetical protein|nr:putative porin [Endomicrobium sp.]
MKNIHIIFTLALMLACPALAQAETIDSLINKLAQKGVLTSDDASEIITSNAKPPAKDDSKDKKDSGIPKWVSNMKISGDITLRTEFIHDEKGAQKYDRIRERARLRLGIETTPVDKLKAFFGIETSGTNPTSAFVDFADFSNAALFLSHAYLQYTPIKELSVSAGKIKNGVQVWKPSQLIWKNDVNPYGAAVNAKFKISDGVNIFANAGWYALTEYRDNETSKDIPMNIIAILQPGAEFKKGNFSAKAAIAFWQFDLQSHSTSTWIKSQGSYTLINPNWQIKLNKIVKSYGLTFEGEYSANVNDSAKKDTQAYIFYLGIGDEKLGSLGTWQLKGGYRSAQANAFPLGMGNTSAYNADPGKGFEGILNLGLLKSLDLNITYYDMTDIKGKKPQQVTQIDFVYKF